MFKRLLLILSMLLPQTLLAQDLNWGAFFDGYYAYDFNHPGNQDRNYTTQPARHNEFNVNLVFFDSTYESEDVRGRIALQAGTSVDANYSAEPANGNYAGFDMVKNIQEAYVGTRLSDNTWIEAGIFFSHIGLESFISGQNLTYTRSLVADFSPFYQAGVRLSHQFSERLSGEFHVLNGWQIVTENNTDKAIGTQLRYAISETSSFTYNTFIGREDEFRHFHDFVWLSQLTESWILGVQADIGFQQKPDSSSYANWYGGALIANYAFAQDKALAFRFEFYSDAEQIIVDTNRPEGLEVISASVGFDQKLNDQATWRSEVRYFKTTEDVYPSDRGLKDYDVLLVTSLTLGVFP